MSTPTGDGQTLALAVPLFDEEEVIEGMVAELLAALRAGGEPFKVALVDNGSTDRTGVLVDALVDANEELVAVHLHENAGYGGGILAGLRSLMAQCEPEVLGWSWGDGQIDPVVIPALYQACLDGAALAKVRRTKREDGLGRAMMSRAYGAVLGNIGVTTADVNGCPKLMSRATWEAVRPTARDWWIDLELVLGVVAMEGRIHEEEVVMRARKGGRSKVRFATVLEFAGHIADHKLRGR